MDGPQLEALRTLAQGSLSQACFGHYAGYFRGMRREHARDGRAKSLLYSYRVALTGAHLLRTGEVVASLPELAPRYGFGSILDIVRYKSGGAEKAELPAAVAQPHIERWAELEALLVESRDASPLPERPVNQAAVNDWLVRSRLS